MSQRDRGKEEIRVKRQREETELKKRMGRDRGEETEGKRWKGRDRGEETSERWMERDRRNTQRGGDKEERRRGRHTG